MASRNLTGILIEYIPVKILLIICLDTRVNYILTNYRVSEFLSIRIKIIY